MSTLQSTPDSSPRSACPLHSLTRPTLSAGGITALLYGLIAYLAFFVAFLYALGFVGNWLVPKSIDSGRPIDTLPSLLINAAVLCIFVAQHTIMARPAFKRAWTRIIPASIERSTFVLFASIALGLVFYFWCPLPTIVWQVTSPIAFWSLTLLSLCGWGLVFIASWMVSHFDLFGLRQTWLRFREREYHPVGFRLVGLYKLVRHPLMLGFLIAFWATPTMTLGHLFFAAMTTAYILFGTWIEERDLIAEHGDAYRTYRRTVPGLIPFGPRAR